MISVDKFFRAEFIEHKNILNETFHNVLVFTKAEEKSTIGKKSACLQLFLAHL